MLTVTCPANYVEERRYAVGTVLGDFLGLDHEIAFRDDLVDEVQIAGDGATVRVADHLFATSEAAWLTPASVPRPPFPEHVTEDGRRLPVIFGDTGSSHADGRFPVDVFGTAFFMLTRYEELADPRTDEWGRYPSTASLAARAGFLTRPLVDEWVDELWRLVSRTWPGVRRKAREPRVILTHDVDLPYSPDYSLSRVARAAWGDVWRRRHPTLAVQRLAARIPPIGSRRVPDPFDTFDFIMGASETYGLTSYFFFIAGHVGESFAAPAYDLADARTRALLRRISARGHEIGLHPSFNASVVPGQTRLEFATLRRICEEEGIAQSSWGSRQHYLRWFNPTTWRECDAAGLSFDSTLVYADEPGFRAGTCLTYRVFDLERRTELALREVPLIVMEDSLLGRRYQGLDGDDALTRFVDLKDACFRVGGNFVLLWHNSELVSRLRRDLYLRLLAKLAGEDAETTSSSTPTSVSR